MDDKNSKSRARRRRDLSRMKKKATKIYHWCEKNAVKYANHLKVCSCWGCGNRRKIDGETKQERLKDNLQDEIY